MIYLYNAFMTFVGKNQR